VKQDGQEQQRCNEAVDQAQHQQKAEARIGCGTCESISTPNPSETASVLMSAGDCCLRLRLRSDRPTDPPIVPALPPLRG
jgi:hypothetical protein